MRHFVQYHNPDIMGPYNPSKGNFWIVTNKRAGIDLDDRVWLITGKGRPRNYLLCETFTVTKLEKRSTGRFKYRASGHEGPVIKKPVKIESGLWFLQLLKATGNFRYGLQLIRSRRIINGLEQVASQNRASR